MTLTLSTDRIPGDAKRGRLLELLAEGYPPPVAEYMAGVPVNTVDFLIKLADNEIEAVELEYHLGKISDQELATNLEQPLIMWAMAAREYLNQTLAQAYENVSKAIKNGDKVMSRWYIDRHMPSQKDQALIELLKMKAANERLQILSRLKEHSRKAYLAALDQMGIESDTDSNWIKEMNKEMRKLESRVKK